jgi:hypothetical protein
MTEQRLEVISVRSVMTTMFMTRAGALAPPVTPAPLFHKETSVHLLKADAEALIHAHLAPKAVSLKDRYTPHGLNN